MSKLKIGDKAPSINAKDENGNTIRLTDYKGKKIVLYFYPKDSTPGCTAEACNLRDNYSGLQKLGFEIIGVSADSNKAHVKFKQKYNLNFSLLSDPEHLILNAYGVWVEKSMYGKSYMGIARTTFIIDEKGYISNIIEKVDTKNHTSQIH